MALKALVSISLPVNKHNKSPVTEQRTHTHIGTPTRGEPDKDREGWRERERDEATQFYSILRQFNFIYLCFFTCTFALSASLRLSLSMCVCACCVCVCYKWRVHFMRIYYHVRCHSYARPTFQAIKALALTTLFSPLSRPHTATPTCVCGFCQSSAVDGYAWPFDLWQPQTVATAWQHSAAIYLLPGQMRFHLLPLLQVHRLLLLQLVERVLCTQTGVQMRATEQHATDERLTQPQRQHCVRHVDEHNATGAAIKRFAARSCGRRSFN